jgi:hypothetical protein
MHRRSRSEKMSMNTAYFILCWRSLYISCSIKYTNLSKISFSLVIVFLVYFVSTTIATCQRWVCWAHGCGFVLMGMFVLVAHISYLLPHIFFCYNILTFLLLTTSKNYTISLYFAASPQILLIVSFLLLLSFW